MEEIGNFELRLFSKSRLQSDIALTPLEKRWKTIILDGSGIAVRGRGRGSMKENPERIAKRQLAIESQWLLIATRKVTEGRSNRGVLWRINPVESTDS